MSLARCEVLPRGHQRPRVQMQQLSMGSRPGVSLATGFRRNSEAGAVEDQVHVASRRMAGLVPRDDGAFGGPDGDPARCDPIDSWTCSSTGSLTALMFGCQASARPRPRVKAVPSLHPP